MISKRPAAERGHISIDWLEGYHSFSFGSYHDPRHMGWSDLRVINDDRIAPNGGFATHGHENMEIVTYVTSGVLSHRDSLGNVETIRAGEVQRMSAGTGIRHSEFNASSKDTCTLLQIWILPSANGLQPGYEQKLVAPAGNDPLQLLVAPGGPGGALHINQDAKIYRGLLAAGSGHVLNFDGQRKGWIQMVKGSVILDTVTLDEGDGAALADVTSLPLQATQDAEFLLFDLRG